ncbi:MAG: hypothetical protein IJI26_01085 [Clostridia bacterium]|nr:hypothetical protein [Clostridia bacterium]
MTIATTTEYGVDEDSEYSSRVTRSVIDNYMKRPSLADRAIGTIATMANNDLMMMQGGTEAAQMFDAAFAFIDQGRVRFFISGGSAAYHFEDGKLLHRSDPSEASLIGSGVRYTPRLEPAFEMGKGKTVILTASRCLAATVSDEALEESLKGAETPEDWMERLKALVGQDKQFCAIAAFLPTEKPSMLKAMLRR